MFRCYLGFLFASVSVISFPILGHDSPVKKSEKWGEIVDPAADCRFAESDGKLTITVPGSHHDLNPTGIADTNMLAPRILREVDGDFVVDVTVIPFARPKANTASNKAKISYLGAGLLVWQDESNFIRLMRSANGERNDLFLHLIIVRDAKPVFGQLVNLEDDRNTYLRLIRKDKNFAFASSDDGEKWTELKGASVDAPPAAANGFGEKLKAGVTAVNATNSVFEVNLENLKVTPN